MIESDTLDTTSSDGSMEERPMSRTRIRILKSPPKVICDKGNVPVQLWNSLLERQAKTLRKPMLWFGNPLSPSKSKESCSCEESLSPSKTKKMIVSSFKKEAKADSIVSPHIYVETFLRSRGYCTSKYDALKTGYYNQPTPLQVASYGSLLVDLVRNGKHERLKEYLSCGLAFNPCNEFGESLVHMSCRLHNTDSLRTLIKCGCDVRIADSNGRTPLHDSCWSNKPCFELIEILLTTDIHMMHIADNRGMVPLQYAPRESWPEWLRFLKSKKDLYWPELPFGKRADSFLPPPLTLQIPNSLPALDPISALPIEMAKMVATGKFDPEEAMFLACFEEEDVSNYEDYDDDESTTSPVLTAEEGTIRYQKRNQRRSSNDHHKCSHYEEYLETDFSFDEQEMSELLDILEATTSHHTSSCT